MPTLHIVVGEPDTSSARECPTCHFDGLLDFPLTALSMDGLSPFGSIAVCARCYDENGGLS